MLKTEDIPRETLEALRAVLGQDWTIENSETDEGEKFTSIVNKDGTAPYALWPINNEHYAMVRSDSHAAPVEGSPRALICHLL